MTFAADSGLWSAFTLANTMAVIGALGLGAIIREVIVYFLTRRKGNSEIRISELTEVQTKVAVLAQIIDQLKEENTRLRQDQLASETRDRDRVKRIRELEDEVDQIANRARETQRQCRKLQDMITELQRSDGNGGEPAVTA